MELANRFGEARRLCYASKLGAKAGDLHCTAGVHPTSTSEILAHPAGEFAYLDDLERLIAGDRAEGGSRRIIAIGEIGLGTSSAPLICPSIPLSFCSARRHIEAGGV